MAPVTVSYSRKGNIHTMETGRKSLGNLVVDTANGAGNSIAQELMAASALFCYCGSLVECLEARGVVYTAITGEANLEMDDEPFPQGRIRKISLKARVALSREYTDMFTRCEKIMRQGCHITGSLHEGIGIAYSLHGEYTD